MQRNRGKCQYGGGRKVGGILLGGIFSDKTYHNTRENIKRTFTPDGAWFRGRRERRREGEGIGERERERERESE